MKERLATLLDCSTCGGELTCHVWSADSNEIKEGAFRCRCGAQFPIINGVPRMVTGALWKQLWNDYPAFFAAYGDRFSGSRSAASTPDVSASAKAEQTRKSFGFEWTTFSGMRPEWTENFWSYLAPKTAKYFDGKTVLDAGCGMGRHLYQACQYSAEAIGVDFSQAVDVAYRNVCHFANAHVVQAELDRLPFRRTKFDFIYCLGVLHHLANPEEVLQQLLAHLKSGAEIRIYVYWDLEGAAVWKKALLTLVTWMRRLSVRLPHRLLMGLCYPTALAAWLAFVLPSNLLARSRLTRAWAETMPLRAYGRYPFGVLVNDTFDRFSAPIEKRYSAEQVRAWLGECGLEEVTVLPCFGWLGHGRKSGEGYAT